MTAAEFRIAVLLEDGFEDDELRILMELFERAGARLTLVSPLARRACQGRHGVLQRIGDSR